ncbi:hypothetical protein N7520_000414 [Penicillium odoratum]|uniref:uncharacterized protein n=1 Tax=Penicillium odoratum TaxID=1167516 RepID=UPI002547D3D5|nr:uncharacterized protein N7520_000414 [Penicillium odoratum]KAJ5777168.1 hypothetical protein N7520_000414 [Penicillium odoratum]
MGLVLPGNIQRWSFTYKNGIVTEMYDIRVSHAHGNLIRPPEQGQSKLSKRQYRPRGKKKSSQKNGDPGDLQYWSHTVQINRTGIQVQEGRLGSRQTREPFTGDTCRKLIGYSDRKGKSRAMSLYRSTIIHPSVYMLYDVYRSLQDHTNWLAGFRDDLFIFHDISMPKDILDPWISEPEIPALGKCRIFVCGKTGAGKSTLLNAVFGVPLTPLSDSRPCEMHHVDEAFESDRHPGIIIHDSRGFQNGKEEELTILQTFVHSRAIEPEENDRLDAIWLCIPATSDRRFQKAELAFLDTVHKWQPNTPVILVCTKKDRSVSIMKDEICRQYPGLQDEDVKQRVKEQFLQLQARCKEQIDHLNINATLVFTSIYDTETIKALVKTTMEQVQAFRPNAASGFIAAQIIDRELKIPLSAKSIVEILFQDAIGWHRMLRAFLLGDVIVTPIISQALCKEIIGCFGLTSVSSKSMATVLSRVVLSNLAKFVAHSIGKDIWNLLAVGSQFLMSMGPPMMKYWPAARMIIKCGCDLIIIVDGSIGLAGSLPVTLEHIDQMQTEYAVGSDSDERPRFRRAHVHSQIERKFPNDKAFYRTLDKDTASADIIEIIEADRMQVEEGSLLANKRTSNATAMNEKLAPDSLLRSDFEALSEELEGPGWVEVMKSVRRSSTGFSGSITLS